jgi:phage tail-like protein
MNEHTRRQFLGTVLPGAVAAGAGLTVWQPSRSLAAEAQQPTAPNPGPAPAVIGGPRAYGPSKFGLELDGQFAGWINSAEGGDATADVVLEKMGADHIQHKHIAGVKYEDITVNCGTGMSKNFYDWIKASFDKQFLSKSGAIVGYDYSARANSRLEWTNGFITEIGFPALDASSKDAGKMTIKISPSRTRMVTGGQGVPGVKQAIQKKWLSANFRLQLAGCQTASTRVSKVEAITLKILHTTNPGVVMKAPGIEAVQWDISNLAFATAEGFAAELYQWHQDFVIMGNNGRDKERGGTLAYLTPDMKESLFTLTFRGLGIFKLAPETVAAGTAGIPRVRAEMYCEDIGFAYSATA